MYIYNFNLDGKIDGWLLFNCIVKIEIGLNRFANITKFKKNMVKRIRI